jgi:hypothetical protein
MDLFRGIREQIPVKCSPKSESVDEAVYYVRLMQVRKNEVGLEIGMTIPTSCRNAAGNGRADMVATLPPEVFEYFYRPQDYDFSRSGGARRFQKWHELEKLRLAEFGWMEGHGKGMYYVHKYATVDVREIV